MLQPDHEDEPIDTAGCSIIAVGHHSLVLRLAGAQDHVIKVAGNDSIYEELEKHEFADRAKSRHVRNLYLGSSGTPLTGNVHGAGERLQFLALDGYFSSSLDPTSDSTKQHAAKLAEQVPLGPC